MDQPDPIADAIREMAEPLARVLRHLAAGNPLPAFESLNLRTFKGVVAPPPRAEKHRPPTDAEVEARVLAQLAVADPPSVSLGELRDVIPGTFTTLANHLNRMGAAGKIKIYSQGGPDTSVIAPNNRRDGANFVYAVDYTPPPHHGWINTGPEEIVRKIRTLVNARPFMVRRILFHGGYLGAHPRIETRLRHYLHILAGCGVLDRVDDDDQLAYTLGVRTTPPTPREITGYCSRGQVALWLLTETAVVGPVAAADIGTELSAVVGREFGEGELRGIFSLHGRVVTVDGVDKYTLDVLNAS